jgi:coenzyme F420-0:L-glutamate ligase / coenzyme F420-1:gamma-L-glutamate ligase
MNGGRGPGDAREPAGRREAGSGADPRPFGAPRPESPELEAVPVPAGQLTVIALEGIGEIGPGDDVGAAVVAALRATPGALPLREDDVLVVTQKIVSKAEGAIVDLTTIEPRPEAVEFAARWKRDPRQLEVVLREARRVVRMANGVLITETPHGFICANGGIDASNMGPRTGDIVTLLPADPDASADRVRSAVAAALGVDVPVIVSDSFGRPWRWGIVDVAIGVSGMRPLDDLRGLPDADGRIMHSTVRATADEIASAAELALGKTARRPVALVRGASPTRGEGRIADVVMAREFDLFG